MCDHHAEALLPRLDFSTLNMASGDAGFTGASDCACRFGAEETDPPDSKRVNCASPNAHLRQGAHEVATPVNIDQRGERRV